MGLVARWLLMGCWVVDDCREVEEDCGATVEVFLVFFLSIVVVCGCGWCGNGGGGCCCCVGFY